jgi:hypothetical protein
MLKFRVGKEINTGIFIVNIFISLFDSFYLKIIHLLSLSFQGDSDVNNNPFVLNGNNHIDKNIQV